MSLPTDPVDTAGRAGPTSSAYHLLHPLVQRRLWRWRWTSLRPSQEQAIPLLSTPGRDLVISAPTASGKTEAAFLPIISNLLHEPPQIAGTAVLYVAPLKALLNDQVDRLRDLCEDTDLDVHIRHGDIPDSEKRKWLVAPRGVLMTTPESLEALFSRRGSSIPVLFGSLRYVVIDELHAFIGVERGAQLQSLLNRLDVAIGQRAVRVGLSATLNDLRLVAAQLNPERPDEVHLIGEQTRPRVQVAMHGIVESTQGAVGLSRAAPTALQLICEDLVDRLSQGHHLVFANSRQAVEAVSDALRQLNNSCGRRQIFYPHHGSLSKELREHTENQLKAAHSPATAVATTTLEMGLDIGAVHSVSQIGPAPGVANLRQRLGRSGRRGQPAALSVYCTESQLQSDTSLEEQLRSDLVQSIAMVDLLLDGWCEDPPPTQLHTSTLVQQLLSLIAERGGVTPAAAYKLLCTHGGPFISTDVDRFKRLLRALAGKTVIGQEHGLLVLAAEGERIVDHHEFFAAFSATRDYRFMAAGRLIGTRPMVTPVRPDDLIVLGARRWQVQAVDHQARRVDLNPSPAGRAPSFGGDQPAVHDTVRRRMKAVLTGTSLPAYLDDGGRQLLGEARHAFAEHRLAERALLQAGKQVLLVPWVGSRAMDTISLMLRSAGINAVDSGLTVRCEAEATAVHAAIRELAERGEPDALSLAALAGPRPYNKHDRWLDPQLIREDYAARALDTASAHAALTEVLTTLSSEPDREGG